MNSTLKYFIKSFLPPVVLNGLMNIGGRRNRWSGDYPDWKNAVAASSGYEADTIFKIVRNSALAVRNGEAQWERDSTCFYHEEYNWHLLACLMTIASRCNGSLHVLDFGGALGSTYMQHRKLLSGLRECTWNVVEQPHIVECGKADFRSASLNFFYSVEECFSIIPVNVVLFSSVLQYLESPYALLEKVVDNAPVSIIIDRTPFSENGERITVQHVPKNIYSASYPCRFLDKQRVESILSKTKKLTPWFSSSVDPENFLGVMALHDHGMH